MPQMSPMNWLMLFFMFSITFIMFNIMNYFFFNPNLPKSNLMLNKKIKNSMNWKW